MQPETSYQRANRLADEAKARKRREYEAREPLPKDAWADYDLELVPILIQNIGTKAGHFQGDRRSTRWRRVYVHFTGAKRPTEVAAFRAARGENGIDFLPVVRQEPGVEYRYCLGCKTRHAVTEFDWDKKRIPPSYRWYCRSWLRRHEARTFKRAA